MVCFYVIILVGGFMENIPTEKINDLILFFKKNGWLDTKNLSDRYYKARELYEHRFVLFKIIAHTYPNLSWKSKRHFEDEMFDGNFIAGITTPLGNSSYHFDLERFDEFAIEELPRAPKYDGYSPDEALRRISSLPLLGTNYIDTEQDLLDGYNNYYNFILDYPKQYEKIANILNEFLLTLKEIEALKTVDITVGYHDFKDLYKQRRELYKLICHSYSNIAWKSRLDLHHKRPSEDTVLVGINTPLGPTGFILNEEHYDSFKIEEIKSAPISNDEIDKEVTKKLSSIKIRNPRANR